MSKTLIIGGGGMVGQKLAHSLADAPIAGDVTLFDIGFPENGAPAANRVAGDVTDPAAIKALAAQRPDLVFHLAAIVSGEAEANFEKGWDINMMAFRTFLEAMRGEVDASGGTYRPRIIFTSSIAVFGAPFPDKIDDEFLCAPQTSYGAQKAISELMLSDYIRKGYFDGMSIRLPTICVRPGKPNAAASGFFSGIIREPLNGVDAVLPVSTDVRHWHASPRSAVNFLVHAATIDGDLIGPRRNLAMPGVSVTVGEQIEALRRVAGDEAVNLIRSEPDDLIVSVVSGWARNFDTRRSLDLGFKADQSFDDIIKVHIEDELDGRIGPR